MQTRYMAALMCVVTVWPWMRAGAAAPSATAPSLIWTYEPDRAGANAGAAVSSAGDVDGDGYGDLIVGVSGDSEGQSDNGEVLLFAGSASGPGAQPEWRYPCDQASAYLGSSVAGAGDIDGDGFDDVVVGAPSYESDAANTSLTNEGLALLFTGSADGLSTDPVWLAHGGQKEALLGTAVAGVGDVNGDGYADVLIGAPQWDGGSSTTNEGAIWLFLGSAAGLSATPDWSHASSQSGAFLGYSVAAAGDVNGDGLADFIAGAYRFDSPQQDAGGAFVFYGSAVSGSPVSDQVPLLTTDQSGAYFGAAVAGAGDVNGDGFSDVIVGAPYYDGADLDVGGAFLFLGSSAGASSSYSWRVTSDEYQGYWGSGVAAAGDVDGDGNGDVLVASTLYDHGQTDEGIVALYAGSSTGAGTSPWWTLESNQANAALGSAVATVGDLNGDGCGELAIGASRYTNGQSGEGRVYLYTSRAADSDGDGFCPGLETGADCDDQDPDVHVGADEVPGDGIDQDCDGGELCFTDGDADGYRPAAGGTIQSTDLTCSSAGLAPASAPEGDCDDAEPAVYPGAAETCNEMDDDCDGQIDEEAASYYFVDRDQDGYGDPDGKRQGCIAPAGYVRGDGDCNDGDGDIHPESVEIPGDEIDANCDTIELCYLDADGDGYRGIESATIVSSDLSCDGPAEADDSVPAGDCDDSDRTIAPGLKDTCDEVDNDCDSILDEDAEPACVTGDADGDGISESGGDCIDENTAVYPGAEESCDGLDANCDGQVNLSNACGSEDGPGCTCAMGGTSGHGRAGGQEAVGLLLTLFAIRRSAGRHQGE